VGQAEQGEDNHRYSDHRPSSSQKYNEIKKSFREKKNIVLQNDYRAKNASSSQGRDEADIGSDNISASSDDHQIKIHSLSYNANS